MTYRFPQGSTLEKLLGASGVVGTGIRWRIFRSCVTFFAVAQFEIELGAVGTRHISFKVAALSDGSAAEAAEIHKDDVLVAIDGKSASSFSMEQIERLFRQDGREYLLSLKRGTKSSKRTLKPKGLSETVQ